MRRLRTVVLVFTLAACGSEPVASFDEGGCTGAKCDDLAASGEFEYIVVGSGAGGGPLASRLARAGHRVLLLEAGADPGDRLNFEVPAFHAQATEEPGLAWHYFVEHYTDPARAARDSKRTPEGILYPRGGALGGSTAVNAMITVLPKNSDWNAIAAETGDPSWRASEMSRYHDRVRGWLGVERPDAKLALEDLRILAIVGSTVLEIVNRTRPGADVSLFDLIGNSREVLRLIAGDVNEQLRRDDAEGIHTFPLAMRDGVRSGTRDLILSTVRAGHPLTVKTRALVTRVILEPSPGGPPVARGVEYLDGARLYRAEMQPSDAPGVPRTARASREVILSAGAFNTPQLLKLSGIGPRAELEAHGIETVVDLPGVGENLQDRYEVGVVNELDHDFAILKPCTFGDDVDPCLDRWLDGEGPYRANGSVVSFLVRSTPDRPEPDLHIFGVPGIFKGYKPGYAAESVADKRHFTWVILKGHTENRGGTVKLRSADPRERPAINFHYFEDGDVDAGQDVNDLTAVVNGVELARKIARQVDDVPLFGAFREVWPGPAADTRAEIGQWVKDEAWGHHASCSAKIGADEDPMAVLDSRFRVRGVKGLRVVDASVFPRIPGTFIALPVYMVSEKAADVILADR